MNAGPAMVDASTIESDYLGRCTDFAKEVISAHFREYDTLNCFPKKIHEAAYDWGLMNAGFPKELGGQGISHRTIAIAGIEMARVCAPTTFSLGFNHGSLRPILHAGTGWQRRVFIEELLESRRYASWCMTESDVSGSNLMNIRSRAEKVDGGWQLNGRKVMTGNGTAAHLFLFLADAWEDGKRIGLSVFAVPKAAGVEVGENTLKLGFRCVPTPDVNFNQVFVSDSHLIGKAGAGFLILLDALDYMRLGGGIVSAGIAVGAIDDVMPWVEEREVYGGVRLSEQSHVQIKIGRLLAEITGLRMLVERVSSYIDQGRDISREAASVKLMGSELAMRATDTVLQLHGWRGVDSRFTIEKRFRDARQTAIYEGTNEILAMNLFRRRLQEHRTG